MNKIAKIKSIECVGEFDDEYVYDVCIDEKTPFYFANNILVHNSCGFSAFDYFQRNVPDHEWTKENAIEMYDYIGDVVNQSFPIMMNEKFNTGIERGEIIKAGREIVGETGIFIAKKRYVVLYYDKECVRTDIKGKPGKLKSMGLAIKRSDTNKLVKEFIGKLIMVILTAKNIKDAEELARNEAREYYRKYIKIDPWKKGIPRKVNNVSKLTDIFNNTGKCSVGHVRASINWNKLKNINNDKDAIEIVDGMKVYVSRLKDNVYGMKSIALPFDQKILPQWFLDLPFDDDEMLDKTFFQGLENVIAPMKWNFDDIKYDVNTNLFEYD